MEDTKKSIAFSGVNPPHSTSKIIERHVDKWIEHEQSLLPLPGQASYSVFINRESYRYYTCQIEVRIGALEWNGLSEGRSIHEAVFSTLKCMKLKNRGDLTSHDSMSTLEATA